MAGHEELGFPKTPVTLHSSLRMDSELIAVVVCALIGAYVRLLEVDGTSMRDNNEVVHTVRTDFGRQNYDCRLDDTCFRSVFRVE